MTILAKKKAKNKEGIIHILNSNPNTNIDQLIQHKDQKEKVVALTKPPPTTKTWTRLQDSTKLTNKYSIRNH
jgi:hypothetical protein